MQAGKQHQARPGSERQDHPEFSERAERPKRRVERFAIVIDVAKVSRDESGEVLARCLSGAPHPGEAEVNRDGIPLTVLSSDGSAYGKFPEPFMKTTAQRNARWTSADRCRPHHPTSTTRNGGV